MLAPLKQADQQRALGEDRGGGGVEILRRVRPAQVAPVEPDEDAVAVMDRDQGAVAEHVLQAPVAPLRQARIDELVVAGLVFGAQVRAQRGALSPCVTDTERRLAQVGAETATQVGLRG